MLRTFLLPLLCLSFSFSLSAQTAFTWEDEQGVLHFSDTPDAPEAAAVTLQEFQASQLEPEELTPDFGDDEETEQAIELIDEVIEEDIALVLSITQPSNDQVIHNNEGNFTVQAELNRQLMPGEQLQLLLGNKPYQAPTSSPTWKLRNIDRGTHRLTVEVKQSGKQIALSPSITVHLQRAVVKKPKAEPRAN